MWTCIKERKLLDTSGKTPALRLTVWPALAAVLGIPLPEPRGLSQPSLPLNELPTHLHRHLTFFELPPVALKLAAGAQVTAVYELVIVEEDPILGQRRAALQRLHEMRLKLPHRLAPLEAEMQRGMVKLEALGRKLNWLRAVLYDDKAEDGAETGAENGAQDGAAGAEGGAENGEEGDAARNGTDGGGEAGGEAGEGGCVTTGRPGMSGRKRRSLHGVMEALLRSVDHANTHALQPTSVGGYAPPPALADDPAPSPSDARMRDWTCAPWVGPAVRSFLAESASRGSRRRSSIGGRDASETPREAGGAAGRASLGGGEARLSHL